MKTNILNIDNQIIGDLDLDEEIFGLPIRIDIMHRVIEWQRAKKRSGTHKTKTISEISGTTKKPYKQKGTGSARHGSLRSAQFRGGSTIFGPVVRSHEYKLTKKIRKLGLKTALSSKFAEGQLIILEDISLDNNKTSFINNKLKLFDSKKLLIIDKNNIELNLKRALNNIKNVNLLPQQGANVYDILKHEKLMMTRQAVLELTKRLRCP